MTYARRSLISIEYRCTNCNLSDTRYRSTSRSHICNRCGHQWGGDRKTTNGRWSSLVAWGREHPFGTLGVISAVLTVVFIANLSEPDVSLRNLIIILVIALISWACTAGYWLFKKSKEDETVSLGDVEELEDTNSAPSVSEDGRKFCSSCGAVLRPVSNFCESCGTRV